MKNTFIFLVAVLLSISAYSRDRITLKGGQRIKGDIIHIEDSRVTIKKGDMNLEFSPEHVELIEFDAQNVKISKLIMENSVDFTYLNGQTDAQLYHKRFGGNFALGVLFGVFGFVGVAVGNVKDPPAIIPDYSDKINSADYREGYRKKGKGKNLGAAGIGWAVSFVLVLLIL
jgi:hypothetical protein